MKKILFLGLILILTNLIFNDASSKQPKQDVKGGYKECTCYCYRYKHNMLDIKSKCKDNTEKYNEKGFAIESYEFNEGNVYEFDEITGINVRYSQVSFDIKNIFKYDEHGYLAEETCYNMDDNTVYEICTFKHDNKGNLTEEQWYNSEDKPVRLKIIYKYDEKENLIEEYQYNGLDSLTWIRKFKCDTHKKLIEEMDYSGCLCRKKTFVYDKKTNLIKSDWYTTDNKDNKFVPEMKNIFKYDDYGNKINEEHYNYKDNLKIKITYIYSR